MEHLEVKAAALTRPAHKREEQELNKAGVDKVVEHDIGRAGVAKELGTHRKADEDGVRHRAHHHKDAELFARQLQEPADEQRQQNKDDGAEQRHEKKAARLDEKLLGKVVQQPVDAHAGDSDGERELADKGFGLRAHPALGRAEIARRREQQDDGDRRDGMQKCFHGVPRT